MAGMNLRTGFSAGASYTPLTPASAQASTSGSMSIAQKAYGIKGSGVGDTGPATAGYGSVGVGVAAIIGLIYLWWSLPR